MKTLTIILVLFNASIHLSAQTDSLKTLIDSNALEATEEIGIIDPVEAMPEFPGGQDSLRSFIERNNNWQVGQETVVGKVYIAFVVEKDGSITNIEMMKGLCLTCDEEATRIVRMMPKWKPGESGGVPVRTKMVLPITFDGVK